MKRYDHVHSERPAHGIFAKVFFPVVAAGFIVWMGMFAHNVSNNARDDIRTIHRQAGNIMVAVTKPIMMSDPEAEGDNADVEATFKTRFAALETK